MNQRVVELIGSRSSQPVSSTSGTTTVGGHRTRWPWVSPLCVPREGLPDSLESHGADPVVVHHHGIVDGVAVLAGVDRSANSEVGAGPRVEVSRFQVSGVDAVKEPVMHTVGGVPPNLHIPFKVCATPIYVDVVSPT